MLDGDFTAFASPACNAGRQITPRRRRFVNNRIDPSRFSPVAAELPEARAGRRPIPCGKLQYGIPNNNTEHQALGKVDYTINANQTLFARYFYAVYDNPATYDGKNVLTLEPHRPEQPGALARRRPQLVLSSDDAQRAARHLQQDAQRSAAAAVLHADRPRAATSTARCPGYMGVSVTGNGFSVGTGGTNPGYFNSTGFQIADDLDLHPRQPPVLVRRQLDPHRDRDASTTGRPTARSRSTVRRPGSRLADFMVGTRERQLPPGQPGLRLRQHTTTSAPTCRTTGSVRPNLTLNVGLRWEPFLPIENTYGWVSHFDQSRFDQDLRSTVYPQAPAGLMFPGDEGYPGDAHDVRQDRAVRAARRRRLDAERATTA